MHLLEAYAIYCGSAIGKPFIDVQKMDVPDKSYITFQPHTGSMSGRFYMRWQEVIDQLQSSIPLVWVGAPKEPKYRGTIQTLGLNVNQIAYLVKHSVAHIGIDSLVAHLAGYFQKPEVIVSGVNMPIAASYPCFNKRGNVACILPPWYNNNKSLYTEAIGAQMMSEIKPETIVKVIRSHFGKLGVLNPDGQVD